MKFCGQTCPLSIVNSVAMCVAQPTQESISKHTAFCWSVWQIHVTNLPSSHLISIPIEKTGCRSKKKNFVTVKKYIRYSMNVSSMNKFWTYYTRLVGFVMWPTTSVVSLTVMASWDSKVSIRFALRNLAGSTRYFLPTVLVNSLPTFHQLTGLSADPCVNKMAKEKLK